MMKRQLLRNLEGVSSKKYMKREDVPPRRIEAELSPEIVASKDHDMLEPQESLLWISLERENLLGYEKSYKKQRDMELQKAPQEPTKDQSHIPVM